MDFDFGQLTIFTAYLKWENDKNEIFETWFSRNMNTELYQLFVRSSNAYEYELNEVGNSVRWQIQLQEGNRIPSIPLLKPSFERPCLHTNT